MLPQLSLPVSASKRVVRRLLQVLCVLTIVVSLTACNGSQPPRALLNEALALQIQLTQSAIASSLDLTPMPIAPSVSRVRVEDQESFALGDEQASGFQAASTGSCPATVCRWIASSNCFCSGAPVVRAGAWPDPKADPTTARPG